MRSRFTAPILIVLWLLALGLAAQSVSFNVSPKVLSPGDKGTISATLTIPSDRKQSVDPNDPAYFYIEASHPDLQIARMVLPKPTKIISDTEWQYYPSVKLSLPFTVKAGAKPGNKTMDVLLSYNLCYASGMCDPPEEKEATLSFTIQESRPVSETMLAGDPDAAVSSSDEPAVEPEVAEAAAQSPAEESAAEPPAEQSGLGEILKYLIFAFLGGLILNITPCVLPILPIRIMSIINQA